MLSLRLLQFASRFFPIRSPNSAQRNIEAKDPGNPQAIWAQAPCSTGFQKAGAQMWKDHCNGL